MGWVIILLVVGYLIYMALRVEFGNADPLKEWLDGWKHSGEEEEPRELKKDGRSGEVERSDIGHVSETTSTLSKGIGRVLLYLGCVVLGMAVGFMARPTIPSNMLWEQMGAHGDSDDVQIPANIVGLYVFNSDRILYEFVRDGWIDRHQFTSFNQAHDFLQSAFDKSIWYPFFGGLVGAGIAFGIARKVGEIPVPSRTEKTEGET